MDIFSACREGRIEDVKASVENDAGILKEADVEGKTPLHHAASSGHLEVVEYLVTSGADVAAVTNAGATTLLLAAHGGNPQILDFLIQKGASPSESDPKGKNVAHFAAIGGGEDIFPWCKDHNISVSAEDEQGIRPIHYAALCGNVNVVKWLVNEANEPPIVSARNGMTPCHYAAMREHTHVIAFLMECGVGLDATDAQGRTPLHVACGALGREAVRALLEAGAQPLLKDKKKQFPEDVANAVAKSKPGSGEIMKSIQTYFKNNKQAPATCPAPYAEEIGDTHIIVRFRFPSIEPGQPPLQAFQVQTGKRSWKDGPIVNGSAKGIKVGGLRPESTYRFRVRAQNSNGWSNWGDKSEEIVTLASGAEPVKVQPPENESVPSEGETKGEENQEEREEEGNKSEAGSTAPGSVSGSSVANTMRQNLSAMLPKGRPTLLEAARNGDVATLQSEVAMHGVESLACVDTELRNPLHLAAFHGHKAAASWILNAVHASAQGGHKSDRSGEEEKDEEDQARAKELLKRYRSKLLLHAGDSAGATPLLLAVVRGHLEVCAMLARWGASIIAADLKGYSTLHYAVLKKQQAILVWLMAMGAPAELKTEGGQTIADLTPSEVKEEDVLPNVPPSFPFPAPVIMKKNISGLMQNQRLVPPPPPPPILCGTSRYRLQVALLAISPQRFYPPGVPLPYEWEVQVSRKRALASWQTVKAEQLEYKGVLSPPAPVESRKPHDRAGGASEDTKEDNDQEPWAPLPGLGDEGRVYFPFPVPPSATGASDNEDGGGPGTVTTNGILFPVEIVVCENLNPDAKYQLRFRVKNRNGWSDWSKSLETKTLPSGNSAPLSFTKGFATLKKAATEQWHLMPTASKEKSADAAASTLSIEAGRNVQEGTNHAVRCAATGNLTMLAQNVVAFHPRKLVLKAVEEGAESLDGLPLTPLDKLQLQGFMHSCVAAMENDQLDTLQWLLGWDRGRIAKENEDFCAKALGFVGQWCKETLGQPVVHLSVASGSVGVAQWLCHVGGEQLVGDTTSTTGATLAHAACSAPSSPRVGPLLEWVATVADVYSAKDARGMLPCHYAALSDSANALDWLLRQSKEDKPRVLTAADNQGRTVFHLASMAGATGVLELCASAAGKDLEKHLSQLCHNGLTCTHYAAATGAEGAVKWIAKHTSLPTLLNKSEIPAASFAKRIGCEVEIPLLLGSQEVPPMPPALSATIATFKEQNFTIQGSISVRSDFERAATPPRVRIAINAAKDTYLVELPHSAVDATPDTLNVVITAPVYLAQQAWLAEGTSPHLSLRASIRNGTGWSSWSPATAVLIPKNLGF